MRPLSGDLRIRFGRALDRGLSARGAARLLEVSAATGANKEPRRKLKWTPDLRPVL
jgi:hypothetical protein